LWEADNWDEEDQVDQQRLKQGKVKRSVIPQVMPQVAPQSETLDCWDDVDEDTLVDNLQFKQAPAPERDLELADELAETLTPAPAPEEDLELTDKLADTLTAPSLPAGEVVAQKVKPAKVERYWGKVRWFRGSYGWVTSDKVSTDRTVSLSVSSSDNTGGWWRKSGDARTIEIKNAIFLGKHDCKGFVPSFGMDVNFRLDPDNIGKLKACDVTLQCPVEDQTLTLDEYRKQLETKNMSKSMQRTSDSKPRETASGHDSQEALKPRKTSRAELSSTAPKDDTQRWFEARMSKPNPTLATRKVVQAKLNARNLELHSCSSSTAPGTSANTSVASELDVQSQASVRAGRPKITLADRPRHMPSSIAVSLPHVPRHFEIVEATEEPASESVPEHWEDEVPEEAHVEEAASDQRPVAESREELSEDKIWDQPPVAAPVVENWEVDEVPECWCPKRPRQKLANKKLAKPKTAPQQRQFAKFCEAMGPEFPFEFLARHLGTDFDAIVQSASDKHSLDSLVQAGMKPLHRNKLCRALRQEMEQRVMRREVPKQELADFLANLGPEFNSAFVAHNLGTNDLDEIITRFTDLKDLDVLVVAGMKPLFRNKLHRQLALERKRRVAEC
jgi:hypothetical protein